MKTSASNSATSFSLALTALNALNQGYQYAVAQLASVMRPRAESPAEAANRLRLWADGCYMSQPSYAADLRAAADRSDHHADNKY